MKKSTTVRLWIARIVAAYAAMLFCFLAYLYMGEPAGHIEKFGVSISGTPESVNFLRAGPGALFTGMAVVAIIGLLRPRRLSDSLLVLIIFTGAVLLGRVYGMMTDGITEMQIHELRDEGISWAAFVVAYLLAPKVEMPEEGGSGG